MAAHDTDDQPGDNGSWLRWLGALAGPKARQEQMAAELEVLRPLQRLDEMDEVELTEYAGAIVASMVRAAKEHLSAVEQQTEQLRRSAEQAAEKLRADAEEHAHRATTEATAAAEKLRADAEEHAHRTTTEATAAAEKLRADAEEEAKRTATEAADALRLRAKRDAEALIEAATQDATNARTQAQDEAQVIHAAAEEHLDSARQEAADVERRSRTTAEEVLAEAISRRDTLLEAVEQQRRWVNSLVADVAELRTSTIGAVNDVRSLTESVAARLTAYTERGEEVLTDVDQQAARLRSISSDRSNPTPQEVRPDEQASG